MSIRRYIVYVTNNTHTHTHMKCNEGGEWECVHFMLFFITIYCEQGKKEKRKKRERTAKDERNENKGDKQNKTTKREK